MKNLTLKLKLLSLAIIATFGLKAQRIADLENLTLQVDTFYDGSMGTSTVSSSSSFSSGDCVFPNKWSEYGYWESGWAYSNKRDSVTASFGNQFSARTGKGYNGSVNYAIGQNGSKLKFNGKATQIGGFYVSNSTYATLSMQQGDLFAKKFGGATGSDPDWFKLKIQKYAEGTLAADSVTFYLADFRFADNTQDYIIKKWEYVDLSSLGNADSLLFTLSSSDVGNFGMNTPAYFCLDDFTTLNTTTHIHDVEPFENTVILYPNPVVKSLTVHSDRPLYKVEVFNQVGDLLITSQEHKLDLSLLSRGIYMVRVTSYDGNIVSKRIIKD